MTTRPATATATQAATAATIGRYSPFDVAATLHRQSVERHTLAHLRLRGMTELSARRVLDVGCGYGYWTRKWLEWGADWHDIIGADISAERLQRAERVHPGVTTLLTDARDLGGIGAFDIISAFTLFSSVLDGAERRAIAWEMWRILRPGGLILIHDFAYDSPQNPAVVGIPPRALRRLFGREHAGQRVRVDVRRCVLAPPIARAVAPRSVWLAQTLEAARVANTHYVAAIWKEASE